MLAQMITDMHMQPWNSSRDTIHGKIGFKFVLYTYVTLSKIGFCAMYLILNESGEHKNPTES